jgi:acetyl-CoA carboxylase biotin carboxylase subunit
MGIISAAIYSDADITSVHVRLADEAYCIGESQASQSYLNKEKIIKLAKKINADAIHPGYGFFSENADFIKSVEDAGITFIGPSSKSVKMMGIKTAARRLMSKSGVPIVPGTTEPVKSVDEGISSAREIGFPLLLKASAGGGGKGMRKIYSEDEFRDAFEAVKRESAKAFGDDAVYLEKYIEDPRHIEVQIIADKHGNYAHLFERECSIQRRHQKIIEESPSSYVDSVTRNEITIAAINAAKACGYYNAGTIEFLMESGKSNNNKSAVSGGGKQFYFLEMNTRLQVEHPVTEMITGIDLVKEQISIAAGNKLSFSQEDLNINGHSFECRIYAEDPENNFLPSTGKISEYEMPSGPGVRVDGGFDAGSEISVFYDPLIAKLICHAKDRHSAIQRMKRALSEYQIGGVNNNISFLKDIFSNEEFIKGDIDINFIERIFMNNHSEKNSDNDDVLKDAAAIFSALKKEKYLGIEKNDTYNSAPNNLNKWTDLMYE